MSVPTPPSSISELPYFRDDPNFRQFAEEHWAALYPLCECPIRVERNDQRLRVIVFGIRYIDRGMEHEFIRCGDLPDEGDDDREDIRCLFSDIDHLVNIEYIFRDRQDFDQRFEFALHEGLSDACGSIERRRELWDFALDFVLIEILQLLLLAGLNQRVLVALELDADAVSLARHYFGWARADQVCVVHQNVAVFRRFKHANPALKRLLVLAFADELIDGQGDVLEQLWSLLRSHGVSTGALRKFMALNQAELDASREQFRLRESFFGLIRTIKFLHWLPARLSAPGLRIMVSTAGFFGGMQSNFDFSGSKGDRRYFLPFMRMLAREVARREIVGELPELERECRLVFDWIADTIPKFDNPGKQVLVIDRQQEKAGWPWLMKKQEEWHSTAIRNDGEWLNPCPEPEYSLSWRSALMSYQDGAFLVEALTDSHALWHEGEEMQHCVGTYVPKCYLGKTRIFSVRDAVTQQALATVELETIYNAEDWRLGQVSGPRNAAVPMEIAEVAKRILRRYVDAAGSKPVGLRGNCIG